MIRKDSGEILFGKGKVIAEIISTGKGPKITVFKYRPKKNYKRWKGHRQPFTEIEIKEIKEV
jgi:large subunit ribosomal protein L21